MGNHQPGGNDSDVVHIRIQLRPDPGNDIQRVLHHRYRHCGHGVSHAARASFTLSSFCIAERIPRSAQRSERNQSNADLLPTGTIKHHERSSLIDSKLRGVEWVFGKFTQSHYL